MLLLKIADDTKLSEGKNNSKDLSNHEFDMDYLVVEVLLPIYNLLTQSDARPWLGQGSAGLVGTGGSLVLHGIFQLQLCLLGICLQITPNLSQWKCLHWPNPVCLQKALMVIQGGERISLEGNSVSQSFKVDYQNNSLLYLVFC